MGQQQSVTPSDKQVVNKVWESLVRKDLPAFGVVLYQTLLEEPRIKEHFIFEEKSFRDDLEKHSRHVMVELNAWINLMEDSAALDEQMKQNAKFHAQKAITGEAFSVLRASLMKTVRRKDRNQILNEAEYTSIEKVLKITFDRLQEMIDVERMNLVRMAVAKQ